MVTIVSSQGTRDRSLDYLRAVAAGIVALSHGAEAVWPDYYRWEEDWFSPGRTGVVVFFLISGHLFASRKLQADRKNFAQRRLLRIYPTYLAALMVYLLVDGLDGRSIDELILNGLLLQSLVGLESIVPPAWTLPIELAFYALIFVFLPVGARGFLRLYFAMLCFAIGFAVTGIYGGYELPSTVPLLVATALLGAVRRNYFDQRGALIGAVVAYAIGVSVVGYSQTATQSPLAFEWTLHGYVLSTLLGLAIFWYGQRPLMSVKRMWLWLGEISYSLYLIHPLGYELTGSLPITPLARYLVYVILAVTLAVVLYRIVERPSLKLVSSRRPTSRREAATR